MRTKPNYPIVTKRNGRTNGILIPVYNINDRFQQVGVQQVYVTTCDAGEAKGPHLHKKRWGYFTCISGDIQIVAKFPDGYHVSFSGESYGYATIEVPAGVPSKIYCVGNKPAMIINTTAPAWTAKHPDDHPVEGWDYD